MPNIKWGIICSVENDPFLLEELRKFGLWLVEKLTVYGSRLSLCRKFDSEPEFLFYSEPGDISSVTGAYLNINEQFPAVIFVLHILPARDSKEYQLMKDLTLNYALIGQGVLLENAKERFADSGPLEGVMDQMNQWISRRMAQIISRQKENNFTLCVRGMDFTQPVIDLQQDFCSSVEAVLHSTLEVDNPEILETIVIVDGFPLYFNKYQIASLFSDFRPKNVLRATGDQAIVDFANKFHAAQVIQIYKKGVEIYDSGGFTLTVRPMTLSSHLQKTREALQQKLHGALKDCGNENQKEIS